MFPGIICVSDRICPYIVIAEPEKTCWKNIPNSAYGAIVDCGLSLSDFPILTLKVSRYFAVNEYCDKYETFQNISNGASSQMLFRRKFIDG